MWPVFILEGGNRAKSCVQQKGPHGQAYDEI